MEEGATTATTATTTALLLRSSLRRLRPTSFSSFTNTTTTNSSISSLSRPRKFSWALQSSSSSSSNTTTNNSKVVIPLEEEGAAVAVPLKQQQQQIQIEGGSAVVVTQSNPMAMMVALGAAVGATLIALFNPTVTTRLDKAKDTITTSVEEATEYATETLIKTAAGDNEEAASLLRKLPATLSAANSMVDELAGSPPSTLQELQAIVELWKRAQSSRQPYEEARRVAAETSPAAEISVIHPAAEALAFADVVYENSTEIRKECAARGFEVIYIDTEATPGNPASFLAFHKDRKVAYLSIRGTHTVADVLTDLVSHTESAEHPTIDDDGIVHAHAGMLASARAIVSRSRPILKGLLEPQGYALVVTGHSLGAGTAALVTILLSVDDEEEVELPTDVDGAASEPSSSLDPTRMFAELSKAFLMIEGSKPRDSSMPIIAMAFACPPVLDATSAVACASRSAGAPLKRFFGTAAATQAEQSHDDNNDEEAPMCISYALRDDIVPRASLRNLVKLATFVNTTIKSDQSLAQQRDLSSTIKEETSYDGVRNTGGLNYHEDFLLPGVVVMLYEQHLASEEESSEWRALACDGLAAPLRVLELCPRSLDDHKTRSYTEALKAVASTSSPRSDIAWRTPVA
mmetsp:Transcript_6487/g.16925  ORF Transcript_6487/g.16925 Transcript_6487/m.16925 type:complete len:632 (+) Transcript_6487:462-2357(+)